MSENKVEINDSTLTHLLGYLDAKKWAIAIRNAEGKAPFTALIWRLIDIQDETYNGGSYNLRREVEEELQA